MRIIAGKAGGLTLDVPRQSTRPTTDRVREALFSSLGNAIIDARILDLYAGSGSLGIESLSRGAQWTDFVDSSKDACDAIQKNLKKTSFSESAKIHRRKVEAFLKSPSAQPYQIIFADPPYGKSDSTIEAIEHLLNLKTLAENLAEGGIFVLESFSKIELPTTDSWIVSNSRNYGESQLTYFQKP